MKVYIAGKVSGTPIAECTMKFGEAQKLIESQGHECVNPLQLVNDWHIEWTDAMRICIKELMTCDAIYALPCWSDSTGATIEVELSRKLNLKLFKIEKK